VKCVRYWGALVDSLFGSGLGSFLRASNLFKSTESALQVENPDSERGYVEVVLDRDDVVVTVGRASIAHAVINIDTQLSTNLVSCTDGLFDPKHPDTDYKVWKDLNH
jgi:hypothetical protein